MKIFKLNRTAPLTENEGDLVWVTFKISADGAVVSSFYEACGVEEEAMTVPEARAKYAETLRNGFIPA